MQELKRKLNVLLLTIIVHLIVIIALLVLKISVSYEDNPPISYMELDFLEEKAEELEKEAESLEEEINIDEYISNLKNSGMAAGLNKQSSYNQDNYDEMSEAELKAKYESDFLKKNMAIIVQIAFIEKRRNTKTIKSIELQKTIIKQIL